jgi:hypothetical protein
MDVIALAKTIQDDKTRMIEAETRRRRLLAPEPTPVPVAQPADRTRLDIRPNGTSVGVSH